MPRNDEHRRHLKGQCRALQQTSVWWSARKTCWRRASSVSNIWSFCVAFDTKFMPQLLHRIQCCSWWIQSTDKRFARFALVFTDGKELAWDFDNIFSRQISRLCWEWHSVLERLNCVHHDQRCILYMPGGFQIVGWTGVQPVIGAGHFINKWQLISFSLRLSLFKPSTSFYNRPWLQKTYCDSMHILVVWKTNLGQSACWSCFSTYGYPLTGSTLRSSCNNVP